MSTTIVDLAQYGDTKGRDCFVRNLRQVTKGTGTESNVVTQEFYGIPSTTDEEYELARISVSENSVDDEIGTFTVGVSDGTVLNDVLSLSNIGSAINTGTMTINADNIAATGTLDIGTVQRNSGTLGSRVELVSDETDPGIYFVLGDLATDANTTPLVITQTTVAIDGQLTIDGTDVFEAITDGNPWTSTESVTQLKGEYNMVEINVENSYTTSVALDLNGSVRVRGNSVFFYDESNGVFYNTLSYTESDSRIRFLASKAGDSLALATTSGTDDVFLDRLVIDDGSDTTNAIFQNVNVGINGTPTGSYAFEVVGNGSFSTGLVSGGDVDLSGSNLLNVAAIQSNDSSAAERASLVLTSDETSPKLDIVLGGTEVANFEGTSVSFGTPATFDQDVTITGNLNVTGTQVVLNTTSVEVQDINIEMGNAASSHTDIHGGGISLGSSVAGITTPTLLYSETDARWETSVGLNVPVLTVGSNTEVADDSVSLKSNDANFFFGANKQWRLGIVNDADGDHFQIAHDDDGTETYVTKLDVLA
ncbi:unknown [Feldmannia species virus]|uniref:Uncharacterized protein n=1 Tax=Feldmannia species virus TaxID=39420 RepID=B5LWD5_9PHYC|nr:hypothetical protein FeldSpV_gp046 [Feldmannia species virus]ACH46798.1 unknown [Feldmannia species virus]